VSEDETASEGLRTTREESYELSATSVSTKSRKRGKLQAEEKRGKERTTMPAS
jgi:hypothetical protein